MRKSHHLVGSEDIVSEILITGSVRLVLAWVIAMSFGSVLTMMIVFWVMSFHKGFINNDGSVRLLTDGLFDHQNITIILISITGTFIGLIRLTGVSIYLRRSVWKSHMSVLMVIVTAAMMGVAVQPAFSVTTHYVTVSLMVVSWQTFYWLVLVWNADFHHDMSAHPPLRLWPVIAWVVSLLCAIIFVAIILFVRPADGLAQSNVTMRLVATFFEHICMTLLFSLDGTLTLAIFFLTFGDDWYNVMARVCPCVHPT